MEFPQQVSGPVENLTSQNSLDTANNPMLLETFTDPLLQLPEASVRGITLRGLIKFTELLQRLVLEGKFPGVTDWKHLATETIVHSYVFTFGTLHN